MLEQELKLIVAQFGKPKSLTVLEVRSASQKFRKDHEGEDLLIGPKDVELALAFGKTPEELLTLDPSVYKSLEELYDEDTASLKQRELMQRLTGLLKSKDSVKGQKKSE